MRQVTVWITAMVAIAFLFLGWYIATPMLGKFKERFDAISDYSDNQLANITYNRLKANVGYANNLILYLFTAVFLIWAFSQMQSKERYSGVY